MFHHIDSTSVSLPRIWILDKSASFKRVMSNPMSKVILSKLNDGIDTEDKNKLRESCWPCISPESSIPAIVRTINSAFSSDPLIQWLRPDGVPWAQPNDSVWRWQYRRVQSVMLRGEVFQTPLVREMTALHPVKQRKESNVLAEEREIKPSIPEDSLIVAAGLDDAGAVVFLFPPKSQLPWSVTRLWQTFKLFVLDRLWPANDKGSQESVSQMLLPVSFHELNADF